VNRNTAEKQMISRMHLRIYLSLTLLGHVVYKCCRSYSLTSSRRSLNQTYRPLKNTLDSKNLQTLMISNNFYDFTTQNNRGSRQNLSSVLFRFFNTSKFIICNNNIVPKNKSNKLLLSYTSAKTYKH